MMNAKNIRSALQEMAAGKLDATQRELLLSQLTEAEAQDALDPVFPAEEWEQTGPSPVDRPELEQLYVRIMAGKKKPAPVLSRMFIWKAACILLLVLAGAGAALYFPAKLHQQNSASQLAWKTIQTEDGKMQKVSLEDGTVVFVNGGTILQVPEHFSSTERLIRLQKGELFIEAAPNAARPLVTEMNGIKVQVLGTSFNCRDYPDEPEASVAVQTGKVAVSSGDASSPILLDPGSTVIYQKQTGSLVRSGHKDDPGGWVKYDFRFNNMPLEQALKKLQHAYGVQFVADDPLLLKRPVKATFRGQQLRDVLRILGKMGSFSYSIDQHIIHIHPQQQQ